MENDMGQNDRKKSHQFGRHLATTVKVTPGRGASPGGAKAPGTVRGLRQKVSHLAQRLNPLGAKGSWPFGRPQKFPHSPVVARPGNMAKVSGKFGKRMMFMTVLTVVLGLAAAGGLALYNSMSRSFRGVTDLADGKRWSRALAGASSGTPSRSSSSRSSMAETSSSWTPRDNQGPQKSLKKKRSGRKYASGKGKKSRKKAARTARKKSKPKKKMAKLKNHKGSGKKTVAHRPGQGR